MMDAAASGTPPPRGDVVAEDESEEPFPELKVELSGRGLEHASIQSRKAGERGRDFTKAGDHSAANAAYEESLNWATKWIWVAHQMSGVPVWKRSVAHVNRAYSFSDLGRLAEAEADLSEPLALNGQNVKARVERANVRYELGMAEAALQDIEQALRSFPEEMRVTRYLPEFIDDERWFQNQGDGTYKHIGAQTVAWRLSPNIADRDNLPTWKSLPRSGAPPGEVVKGVATDGWIKVEIQENRPKFFLALKKKIETLQNAKARYELGMAEAALQDVEKALQGFPVAKRPKCLLVLKENIETLYRKQVEERRAAGEPYPECGIERSLRGLDDARSQGRSAMCEGERVMSDLPPALSNGAGGIADMTRASQRSMEIQDETERAQKAFQRSFNWLNKAIWLVDTGQISGVEGTHRSAMHYERAEALSKLGRWEEAEADCSETLALNGKFVMAQYRRAIARYELGKAEAALQDIKEVLKPGRHWEGGERQAIDEMSSQVRLGTATEFRKKVEALRKKQAVDKAHAGYSAPAVTVAPVSAPEAPAARPEDFTALSEWSVKDDEASVIDACRKSGISTQHDHLRRASLGCKVRVLQIDSQDNTVQCRVPDIGDVWFGMGALAHPR
eukprot:TRINITY_DN3139_c0_g1_i1.p1 TRINITY_DN3139_c0_g1~~TRINITY_DN3139_c0_g1_i1.p1  ORF type:complete len:619 (+),score=104.51 TRINITY_DN3139_c0_g1_i1:114-1970(+)